MPASLHPADIEAAWSYDDPGPAVIHAWQFLKLTAHSAPVGMVAIQGRVDTEHIDLARSLCEQATVALDRTRLVADLEQARLVSETEQLRSALLSSVSHDLRTPLDKQPGSTDQSSNLCFLRNLLY